MSRIIQCIVLYNITACMRQPLGATGKAVANAVGAALMSPPADAPPVPDPAVSRARVPVTWSDC